MEVTLNIEPFTEVGLSPEESTTLAAASILVAHYQKSGILDRLDPRASTWVARPKTRSGSSTCPTARSYRAGSGGGMSPRFSSSSSD
jgi:hypothetical protein